MNPGTGSWPARRAAVRPDVVVLAGRRWSCRRMTRPARAPVEAGAVEQLPRTTTGQLQEHVLRTRT